jgi:hypothetical protein
MSNDNSVMVEVPVTVRVSVAFPGQAPPDPQAAAKQLVDWFAGKVLHVSHAQISACNELNRLSPHGAGVVTGVEAVLRA